MDQVTVDYGELPWPDTVVEAVRRRVRQVHPETYQVLEASAVLGHRFDLDLAQAASGRSKRETGAGSTFSQQSVALLVAGALLILGGLVLAA